MKKYICTACEWVYDPAVGDPDGGIAPGTPFEDIPDDWVCPVCGLGKDAFEEVQNNLLLALIWGIYIKCRFLFIYSKKEIK